MTEPGPKEPPSDGRNLATSNSNDTPPSASGDSYDSHAYTASTPPTPGALSRNNSFSDFDEQPIERLTMFDLLENLALPQRLEKFHHTLTQRASRSQERIKTSSQQARERVIEEWRRRVPTSDEQLDRYKKRMRRSVDRLSKLWQDSRSVTLWEKFSFIAGVLNIFICGYLVGAHPELFHYWYTVQLAYFLPIRFYTYRKKGYHYFLADLCYFVNILVVTSIYIFPRSKRVFISAYCLAFGNNAIAIAMWRNSLVFHSMDKIVSLFIHIMPCVTLHCLVHLLPAPYQKEHYPAIHAIVTSTKGSPEHYTLPQMMFWASWPYAVWQLSYHFLISVRRRDQIAAGRPTSFTWLRKSFANVWIGRIVLSLPDAVQEPAYMFIQYAYALLTMLPCPLWFWSRWASGLFLASVFTWSVWNGATYYIDVFGNRFQKELAALKADVAKWQTAAELAAQNNVPLGSPPLSPGDLDAKTPGLNEKTIPPLDEAVDKEHAVPGVDGGLTGDELEGKKDI
ncbi:hypothetical protein BT63DRAFT_430135 [Microthyrium microscopicum]|uniref:Glycerophosphocholine acyltransferase 1 n=1 Tax=Microthyrium microscopicum TaxID=703497 RepID=A0A6A6TY18_9PEZI|nr:hypothetical protein BT63DRAFT_430135 [Microthyrium microscopicum]